ncbi:MAG: biotin--[acetyl-CoA-carboxylase] ligase [Henriciella sp.]|nr:biotin--[acetyl-CoA-carboxylase] ligase [Henriciella sp.]
MTPDAPVYWYDNLDSTSEEARRRARAGERGPLWVAARQQTAGRGRLGRIWVSPIGNLFTTVLFVEPAGLEQAVRIPFATGLAVVDTCKALLPNVDFRLKWPNDVRVNQAKLSGILIESGESNGAVWIAAGIGLNVQHIPDGTGQTATSLHNLGAPPVLTPEHVLEVLRTCFATRLKQSRTEFSHTLRDWLKVAEGLGQTVRAGPPNARIEGVFEGLADDGGLILRLPDGQTRTIRAGDVELVRHVD